MKVRDLSRVLNKIIRDGKGGYEVVAKVGIPPNESRGFIEEVEIIDVMNQDFGLIELKQVESNREEIK